MEYLFLAFVLLIVLFAVFAFVESLKVGWRSMNKPTTTKEDEISGT